MSLNVGHGLITARDSLGYYWWSPNYGLGSSKSAAVHLKYLGVCPWSSSDFLSELNNENVTIISALSEPDSAD